MSNDVKNVTSNQVSAILAPTPIGHQLPQLDLLGLHLVDKFLLGKISFITLEATAVTSSALQT